MSMTTDGVLRSVLKEGEERLCIKVLMAGAMAHAAVIHYGFNGMKPEELVDQSFSIAETFMQRAEALETEYHQRCQQAQATSMKQAQTTEEQVLTSSDSTQSADSVIPSSADCTSSASPVLGTDGTTPSPQSAANA